MSEAIAAVAALVWLFGGIYMIYASLAPIIDKAAAIAVHIPITRGRFVHKGAFPFVVAVPALFAILHFGAIAPERVDCFVDFVLKFNHGLKSFPAVSRPCFFRCLFIRLCSR